MAQSLGTHSSGRRQSKGGEAGENPEEHRPGGSRGGNSERVHGGRTVDSLFQSLGIGRNVLERAGAAAWLASGAHGAPRPPAESIAMAHHPGPHAEPVDGEDRSERRRQANRDRRTAKRKRWAAEREELSSLREQRSKGDFNKGRGKGKGKDQAGQEICYSWAKSVGPCAGLAAGSECKGKIKRVHKCMLCFSPAHPNAECPKKTASPVWSRRDRGRKGAVRLSREGEGGGGRYARRWFRSCRRVSRGGRVALRVASILVRSCVSSRVDDGGLGRGRNGQR